jgi:phosphoglycerate dehydrogenase-like enzyme
MNNTNKQSPKIRIALLDDYHNRASSYADWSTADFAEFHFFSNNHSSEAELITELQDYDAVGLMRERTAFPKHIIEQLPRLRLIVTTGRKNASIDVTAATEHGITVCGTESPGHATAELAFLMVMALSRQLVPLSNALQQTGDWQPVMGRDMRNQTLGIIGLGRLGGQLAGFAKAMGMHVIAWSENLTAQRCAELDVTQVSRNTLFSDADTVSIHLRHSLRTHNMIGTDDLVNLGSSGYLVNTSRADIVAPGALRHALDNDIIAGAATDVFEQEPAQQSHWMVQHPKVLATPHIGYCTNETFEVFYQQMLEAFEAYFKGAPIRVISSS